jgi:hypothetical protein
MIFDTDLTALTYSNKWYLPSKRKSTKASRQKYSAINLSHYHQQIQLAISHVLHVFSRYAAMLYFFGM